MQTHDLLLNKIISRLEMFNYRFERNESSLKVFLPMWCYLKLRFTNDQIKFTSHTKFGFPFLPIEYNFFIYSVGLYILSSFFWEAIVNKGILFLFGMIIILLVICFIKTESMKSILHQWIELENQKSN